MNWKYMGASIQGQYLNLLGFSDDILLIRETLDEEQETLNDLNRKI